MMPAVPRDMNNNSKSGLVALLSVVALGIASLGLLGRGAPAQAAVAPAPEVVEMPEMTITAPAPAVQVDYSVWAKPAGSNSARAAKPRTARKPAVASPKRTVVRELEQGGIFGVGTSSTQTVRCVG